MAAGGVRDFGLKDVFKPEPQRLRRHLSAVVNFAKFRCVLVWRVWRVVCGARAGLFGGWKEVVARVLCLYVCSGG